MNAPQTPPTFDLPAHPLKILAISSGGGHWIELMRLLPAFHGHRVIYATVGDDYRSYVPDQPFHRVNDATRWNKFGMIKTASQVLWIILRRRPDIVISTGALPGYFGLRFGKWFGAKTIWLDSIANAEQLSLSGQRAARHADLWLTQWPHLASPNGPACMGAVL